MIGSLFTARLYRLVRYFAAAYVLAIATPVIASASNISLRGSWTYSQTGSTVVLTADRIENDSSSGTSGTLRMELWAFPTAFNGFQSGYRLAVYTLPQQLSAGFGDSNISSGPIPFAAPPADLWHFALLITEFNGSTFVWEAYSNADAVVVCDGHGTCGNGNATYHGGPVQHNQKVYTVFWNPPGTSFPDGYQTAINQFVQDLNGSAYYGIASQYGDSNGNISPAVSLGGTWADNANPLPQSPPSTQDVFNEVTVAITANNWLADQDSLFLVYTPSDVTSDNYCGYHAWFAPPQRLAFGLILFPATQPDGKTCLIYPAPWPNGQIVDHAIKTTAHEIVEAATDPGGDGWYLVGGSGEIGDLCAGTAGPRDSSGADLHLNGNKYLVQKLWSNAVSGCAMTAIPATGTITGAPNPCVVASGNSCTSVMAWGTQNVNAASLRVSLNGGPEIEMSSALLGSVAAAWIVPGNLYKFALYNLDTGIVLSSVYVTGVRPIGSITAGPNPCTILSGNTCTAQVSWTTQNVTSASVRVSVNGGAEAEMARSVSGSVSAPWIMAANQYTFLLYNLDTGLLLNSVAVTAKTVAPPTPPTAHLSISGNTSWQQNGSSVTIHVDDIDNTGTATSGKLRIELWGTITPYAGGSVLTGYVLTSFDFVNVLGPNQYFSNVTQTGLFTRPPAGRYYTTLTLEEFTGSDWVIRDYVTYNSTSTW